MSDTGTRVISKAPGWVPFQGSKNAKAKQDEINRLGQKRTECEICIVLEFEKNIGRDPSL